MRFGQGLEQEFHLGLSKRENQQEWSTKFVCCSRSVRRGTKIFFLSFVGIFGTENGCCRLDWMSQITSMSKTKFLSLSRTKTPSRLSHCTLFLESRKQLSSKHKPRKKSGSWITIVHLSPICRKLTGSLQQNRMVSCERSELEII